MILNEYLNFHNWILCYQELFHGKIFYSILLWLFLLYCSQFEPTKKNLILKFAKSMSKPPSIWLMYLTLQANFGITLHLMKSHVCVPLHTYIYIYIYVCIYISIYIYIYTKTCNKATIYVSEWLLIPCSPCNIKWKKLNLKETRNSPKIGILNFEQKVIAQLQKMFCKIPMRRSLLCYFANLFTQKCCLILRGD